MAEARPVPQVWIDQKVHVVYVGGDREHSLNCMMQEVNELGIAVVADDRSSFFPWSNVIRVDLGHGSRGRQTLGVRR